MLQDECNGLLLREISTWVNGGSFCAGAANNEHRRLMVPTKWAHNAHCSNSLRAIASYFPLCFADPMGVLFSHENSDLSASKPTKRAHNAHCSNTLRAIASYFPLCLADPLGSLFSHENSDLSTSKYAMTTFQDCVKKFEVSGAHILFAASKFESKFELLLRLTDNIFSIFPQHHRNPDKIPVLTV